MDSACFMRLFMVMITVLETVKGRGAWRAAVHGSARS